MSMCAFSENLIAGVSIRDSVFESGHTSEATLTTNGQGSNAGVYPV